MKIIFFVIIVTLTSNFTPIRTVDQNTLNNPEKLDGYWVLNYISGTDKALDELYHEKLPVLNFSIADKSIVGSSGCNSFFSKLKVDSINISYKKGMARTYMACPGKGESIFWKAFGRINKYSISDDTTLNLKADDIVLMRFSKRDSLTTKETQ